MLGLFHSPNEAGRDYEVRHCRIEGWRRDPSKPPFVHTTLLCLTVNEKRPTANSLGVKRTQLPFEIWQENDFAFLNKTIKFDVKQMCENQVSQESEER